LKTGNGKPSLKRNILGRFWGWGGRISPPEVRNVPNDKQRGSELVSKTFLLYAFTGENRGKGVSW